MAGFDLNEATALLAREDAGENIHVKDAAGKPMYFGPADAQQPVTLCVRGWHSATVRKLWDAMQEKIKTAKDDLTPEQRNEYELAFAADCITGWAGFFTGDAELPFTRENAITALRFPWLYAQVDTAIFEHSRFFPSKSAA